MRCVLDEGVPRDVARLLAAQGCDVAPFPNVWKGTKNGSLLALIRSAGFECLITCDRNLHHQQNVTRSGLAVICLSEQRLERLIKAIPLIAQAVEKAAIGRVEIVNILVGPAR